MIGSEAVKYWREKKPVFYKDKQVYILKFNCRVCPVKALIASQYSWQSPKQWVYIKDLESVK